MKVRSATQHNFAEVPQVNIQRSMFDRSHGFKTTLNAGYLIPIYADEVVPGDTLNLQAAIFARFATLEKPVMDNAYADVHFWAVPERLLWNNFQKFMGEQENPGDSTDYLWPVVTPPTTVGFANETLFDYLGVPTLVPNTGGNRWNIVAKYSRAYNFIWNTNYRDENLQDSVVVDLDDGPDDPADYVILRRGKRFDYFTSSLPEPQKGPSATLPLGTQAPIILNDATTNSPILVNATSHANAINQTSIGSNASARIYGSPSNADMAFDPNDTLLADLSAATAATINQLRQAITVQQFYERDARGGTRYTEIILSHFGVTAPDFRLQRPEYLGGFSSPINIHPVAQTSGTPATGTPQGNLSAFGTFSNTGQGFVKSFVEHSVVIGLLSIRTDMNYQQGLNKKFKRRSKFDYYWPTFAHLGEQAVMQDEIYLMDDVAQNATVFGYQERYADYRYMPNLITGKFRSNDPQSLDVWHWAQDFASAPQLNDEFIVENPPIDRTIAVTSEPQFLLDVHFSIKSARPMPVYSVPGLRRL